MSRGVGITQQKILILLAGGVALGFSRSPQQYSKVMHLIGKEWRQLNRHSILHAIRSLYHSKLIEEKKNKDGSITLVLSEKGAGRVLRYTIDDMKIKKPKIWDKKWRFVAFDIPEYQKKVRDVLRFYFRQIGFREFQKSIFLIPYPCEDEVEFIIEYFQARPYVRMIVADSFDNELHWKEKFNLSK